MRGGAMEEKGEGWKRRGRGGREGGGGWIGLARSFAKRKVKNLGEGGKERVEGIGGKGGGKGGRKGKKRRREEGRDDKTSPFQS